MLDVISNRRSVRKYENREISKDVLDQILEAGRQSPSAMNRQPYRFVVVTKSELKKEIKSLFSRFVEKAPVVIVGCADVKAKLTGKWAVVDATIGLENMCLAAWSLGVGSCWIGSFNEKKVKEVLNIPEDWKVVCLLTLGYAAEEPKQKKRKSAQEVFGINRF